MNALQRVTLIVATKNRGPFLVRLLRYYAQQEFPGTIIIGDGSDDTNLGIVAKEVAEMSGGPVRVRHMHTGAEPLQLTFQKLSELVETEYATLLGDDDYLVPTGLEKCVEFLDANPDFVAANGGAWSFESSPDGPHGRIRVTGQYPQPDLDDDDPAARMVGHMSDYRVTLFSVHRAEAWRDMWSGSGAMPDRSFGAELLPCCISPILGKIRQLDCMYLFRQSHSMTYHLPGHDDWMERKEWPESFDQFCNQLGARLSRNSRLDVAEAADLVEDVFAGKYLSYYPRSSIPARRSRVSGLVRGTEPDRVAVAGAPAPTPSDPTGRGVLGLLRRALRRVPFLRTAFLKLFHLFWLFRIWRAKVLLRKRLTRRFLPMVRDWEKRSSPYYVDFQSISRSVAGRRTGFFH